MTEAAGLTELLANLLSYPNRPIGGEWVRQELDQNFSEQICEDGMRQPRSTDASARDVQASVARNHLMSFRMAISHLTVEDMEELYTRTFDINPVSNLEVGWHLYGEQYERGAFLVNMRGMLRSHGVAESAELPDHLTHVLRLLGRMSENEAHEFSGRYVLPAVNKMLEGFKDKGNPYEHVLLAVKVLLGEPQTKGAAVDA